MVPSCLASVSRAAEQVFDCLQIYLHRSHHIVHFSAENHILLNSVTFHSESELSLHKITSYAGGQALKGLPPDRLHLEHLLVYMNRRSAFPRNPFLWANQTFLASHCTTKFHYT